MDVFVFLSSREAHAQTFEMICFYLLFPFLSVRFLPSGDCPILRRTVILDSESAPCRNAGVRLVVDDTRSR